MISALPSKTEMEPIRVVFLDVDNTLLDFSAYVKWCMQNGFAELGLRPYEDWMFPVFTEINNRYWTAIEQGTIDLEYLIAHRWNTVFEALDIHYDGVAFENYFRRKLNECAIPMDGAFAMLDYLQGKAILCAATNGPDYQQWHRLTIGKMSPYFRTVFTSQGLGVSKPSEAFFTKAMDRISQRESIVLTPSQCLMIGDSYSSDISGAAQMGMSTILISNSYQFGTHPDLEPDYLIRNARDISSLPLTFAKQ